MVCRSVYNAGYGYGYGVCGLWNDDVVKLFGVFGSSQLTIFDTLAFQYHFILTNFLFYCLVLLVVLIICFCFT